MALTVINGRDGNADFVISGKSWRTILNEFEVESNVEMIDSSVFSIEGVPTQEPGMEQLILRMTGLCKKGAPATGGDNGLLIPAPQNVVVVPTFSTGCFISGSWNFRRAMGRRTVNRNGIISGEAISNGAFAVTWDKTS